MKDAALDRMQQDFASLSRRITATKRSTARLRLKHQRSALSGKIFARYQALLVQGKNISRPNIGPAVGKRNPDFQPGGMLQDSEGKPKEDSEE